VRIVGIEASEPEAGTIHTIDVWYSQRSGRWIVERLDANGDRIGTAHVCADRAEAEDCLADWMRTHSETHLVAPFETLKHARAKVRRAA
jgi:hypothetical protein